MRKRIFNRLSVKVFLITFIIQIVAGVLICATLYLSTPKTYQDTTDEGYMRAFQLSHQLSGVPEREGGKIIDDFIRETGIDIAIYNMDRSTIDYKVFADTDSKLSLKTKKEVDERREALIDKTDTGTFDFWYQTEISLWKSNENPRYQLVFFLNETKENFTRLSIRKSMPVMIVCITVLSLMCSCIYTLLFAKPVKKLSAVSKAMANMDFSKKCASRRKDEIGDLARDLDVMAEALEEKMQTLSKKNEELSEEVALRKELESQKTMFFSAASHELKTPVTVLEGQLRGMIEGVGPYSDHEEYLPHALSSVKRMEKLINDILTASKMQSGKEIVTMETDMVQLLEEKMEECEALFEARGIKMELSFENDLIFEGNKELTSMALGAFLSNAAFYTEEGETVEVDAEKEKIRNGGKNEKNESTVIRVKIRNTGAHIDKEDIAHLFEPFYRPDQSRNRRSGGSGLGLYLARLILEKQGGTCWIRNDGDAVLATIELPAAEEHASSKTKKPEEEA